jgi:hypothetical protein
MTHAVGAAAADEQHGVDLSALRSKGRVGEERGGARVRFNCERCNEAHVQNVIFDPCRQHGHACCDDTFGTPEFIQRAPAAATVPGGGGGGGGGGSGSSSGDDDGEQVRRWQSPPVPRHHPHPRTALHVLTISVPPLPSSRDARLYVSDSEMFICTLIVMDSIVSIISAPPSTGHDR